jgi:hypothetical protein
MLRDICAVLDSTKKQHDEVNADVFSLSRRVQSAG